MAVRSRPMQAADIHECVEIVAAHPVVGPRYQDTLEDLHVAWHRLLDCDAKNQFVFEEVEQGRARILAAGVSVFVTDDFVRWLKTPPFSWFGPELARRIARGQLPLMSDKELREANSGGGLNLLYVGTTPSDPTKSSTSTTTSCQSSWPSTAAICGKRLSPCRRTPPTA